MILNVDIKDYSLDDEDVFRNTKPKREPIWFSRRGVGIQSTYFKKNAFSSKTRHTRTTNAHCTKRKGLDVGFQTYESHVAGVKS